MYCIFEDMFGSNEYGLANYLWGDVGALGANQYPSIGLITIGICFIFAFGYYIGMGNYARRPSWGTTLTWVLAWIVTCGVAFGFAWGWTLSDLNEGLMVTTDAQTGGQTDLDISEDNCALFGFANVIIAAVIFFLLSMALKWGSKDYKHIPI